MMADQVAVVLDNARVLDTMRALAEDLSTGDLALG